MRSIDVQMVLYTIHIYAGDNQNIHFPPKTLIIEVHSILVFSTLMFFPFELAVVVRIKESVSSNKLYPLKKRFQYFQLKQLGPFFLRSHFEIYKPKKFGAPVFLNTLPETFLLRTNTLCNSYCISLNTVKGFFGELYNLTSTSL